MNKARLFQKEYGDIEQAIRAAIRYCREHEILKEFLETYGTEVMKMLMAEWNWEEAEALLQKDFLEIGMEKGMEKGREEGWEKRGFEIARNALAKGFPPETISELTGLDTKTIQSLSTQQ